MANVGQVAVQYVSYGDGSTTGYFSVAVWSNRSMSAGTLTRATAPSVGNERIFVVTVGGTTGATQPTWPLTQGGVVTLNSVTYIECTGQAGVNGDIVNAPTWLMNKNTAITTGLVIYVAANSSLQICSVSGTTGNASQPAFSTTAGTATTDNTATWRSLGLASSFTAFKAPHARLNNAIQWTTGGSIFYVSNTSAETRNSSGNLFFNGTEASPSIVLCVSGATAPPTTTTTGASVSTTVAGSTMGTGGSYFMDGMTLQVASGATETQLAFSGNWVSLKNCSLKNLGSAGFNSDFSMTATEYCEFNNTTFTFGSTGQTIFALAATTIVWRNTPSAVLGTTPTTLFTLAATAVLNVSGVDMSAVTGTLVTSNASGFAGAAYFTDCKLGSGVTILGNELTNVGVRVEVTNCDSSTAYYRSETWTYQGTKTVSTTLVRTDGASDGTTPISWKITTNANTQYINPFRQAQIAEWNDTTGANVTVTLYGVWNSATVPTNEQIWIEAQYFGSATSPQASFANNSKANYLSTAANLNTDTTSAWDSAATARLNTHAYSLGDVISVSSNTGRIFFCTTAGTSAGSLPGGYASAVDGGTVTDNTAVFRAGFRFALAVTLNSPQPAKAGPIYVTVCAALASSVFYVDPLVNLS